MRAKLKEISDELDTLHSYNRELKGRLGEQIRINAVSELAYQASQQRNMRLSATIDASIITMYGAIVVTAITIGLLVFVW